MCRYVCCLVTVVKWAWHQWKRVWCQCFEGIVLSSWTPVNISVRPVFKGEGGGGGVMTCIIQPMVWTPLRCPN